MAASDQVRAKMALHRLQKAEARPQPARKHLQELHQLAFHLVQAARHPALQPESDQEPAERRQHHPENRQRQQQHHRQH